jgi:hypothetical protein
MMLENREKDHCLEQELFFNKERILRWMRWFRGNKDLHPDLQEYERQQELSRCVELKLR